MAILFDMSLQLSSSSSSSDFMYLIFRFQLWEVGVTSERLITPNHGTVLEINKERHSYPGLRKV